MDTWLFRCSFVTKFDALNFATEEHAQFVSDKVREIISPPLYPNVKVFLEYKPENKLPGLDIYQIYLYPYKADIQLREKLSPEFRAKKQKEIDDVVAYAKQYIKENKENILRFGLSPLRPEALDELLEKPEIAKDEYMVLLQTYRNIIDCWKHDKVKVDNMNMVAHCRALAYIIGRYIGGDSEGYTVKHRDKFDFNTYRYIKRQLEDPEITNNFLLNINMIYS